MNYFPLAVEYCQKIREEHGNRTLVSMIIPYSIAFMVFLDDISFDLLCFGNSVRIASILSIYCNLVYKFKKPKKSIFGFFCFLLSRTYFTIICSGFAAIWTPGSLIGAPICARKLPVTSPLL